MTSKLASRVALVADDEPRLVLEGTIDALLAHELLDAAKASLERPGRVSVDCSTLERIDAAALQVLLALARALNDLGRAFEMTNVNLELRGFITLAAAERLLLTAPAEGTRSSAPDASPRASDAAAELATEADPALPEETPGAPSLDIAGDGTALAMDDSVCS